MSGREAEAEPAPDEHRRYARYLDELAAVDAEHEPGLVAAVLRDPDVAMARAAVVSHVGGRAGDLLSDERFPRWAEAMARRARQDAAGACRRQPAAEDGLTNRWLARWRAVSVGLVIYEHPLAYLLGLEGIALSRGFIGEFDRDFTQTRIAEVRRLLDDEQLTAVDVDRVDTVDGYRAWAPSYDQPGNAAFDLDEPEVRRIVDAVAPGVALDAACGTGRYARLLTERGHRVIGVDSSADMLSRARARVPTGEFLLGDLHRLPVADSHVDLVVCGLALTHLPDVAPAVAEFARVLRPGGHLVIVDVHPEAVLRGSIPSVRGPDGRPGRLVSHRHLLGDYLRAALPVGLRVLGCVEPRMPAASPAAATTTTGPWDVWPWSLAAMVPEAARAAAEGAPAMVIWHFRLSGS